MVENIIIIASAPFLPQSSRRFNWGPHGKELKWGKRADWKKVT